MSEDRYQELSKFWGFYLIVVEMKVEEMQSVNGGEGEEEGLVLNRTGISDIELSHTESGVAVN